MAKHSNKFGELSKLFTPLNIVIVVAIVLLLIIVSFSPGGSGKAPLPKMVPGWNQTLFQKYLLNDTYQTDPGKKYTLEQCQQLAASEGAKYFTYRTMDHPADALRNTCIVFKTPDDYIITDDMAPNGLGNASGCVDPSKMWTNCN
jgi:hypothetical protein